MQKYGYDMMVNGADYNLIATFEATKKWTSTIRNWGAVYGELSIMYEGRLPEQAIFYRKTGGWPPVLDYVFTYSGSRPSYMILNSP